MRSKRWRAEQGLRVEIGRVAAAPASTRSAIALARAWLPAPFRACAAEMSRPKKRGVRIAPGGQHKIAAGAAAEFQHGAAWRHIEPGDHAVAAEQIIFAGQVVDMALVAVDAVHQRRMADARASRRRSSGRSSHRDGSRHRSPSGRARVKSTRFGFAHSSTGRAGLRDAAGQQARLGGGAEDHARARRGGAGDLGPQLVELARRSSSPARRAGRSGRRCRPACRRAAR